jgi:hypothetical protein
MLNDLIFVLRRIKEVIESSNLPSLYNNLASLVQQASSGSTPELQTQIKQIKDQIRQEQNKLSIDGWSYSQKHIFNKFGAAGVVGTDGLRRFESSFSENSGVPSAVVNELNQQANSISQLLTNTNNVLTSLGGLSEVEKSEEGKGIVEIVFQEEVAIENLTDLSSQSVTWEKIIRAYSILADEAPENTKIIATNKVNPFFLWLATAPLISKAICATVKPFIDLWHEILKLQEATLTLEEKKIAVAEKKLGLRKELDAYENQKVIEILEHVADTYTKEELPNEKRNEGKNNLLKYGPNIYKFIKAHGEVDASQDGNSSPVTSNLQLAGFYREVHQLEKKVQKMLAASNNHPDQLSTKDKKTSKANSEKRDNSKKDLAREEQKKE